MNEQNLIPVRTKSEARERGKNGGIKSGEARRKKKTMKEQMNMLLNSENDKVKETVKTFGIEDEEINNQMGLMVGLYQSAMKGNVQAFEKIQELNDDNEDSNRAVVCIPAKNIAKSFIDVYRSISNREYIEYWLEGGRGSTKSSFAGEILIELLENNHNMCAIVIRRYTNTLKDSVGAQLEWAVSELNDTYPWLTDEYTFKKSPLEAVKNKTNQRIYFRGTDDPGKIKSIKPPKGMHIGIIWYEEFDQIQGMNAVRKINQSIVRGGEDFIQLYTYNTPASRMHFVNKEKRIPKKTRLVHLSDYRSVPKEWLGQAFIDEAEYIKETAPTIYENEYLGLETGDGGSVFENVEVREITDEEINAFDWIYKGIDWGWYPDPFAYNNMYYNSNKRELYIFDELDCNKKSNAETWQMLKDKGVKEDDLITADSAEPKSIGDYRSYGSSIRGAVKGPRKC